MLLASSLWLTNLSMVKLLSDTYSPAMLSFIRTGVSALLLIPVFYRADRAILKVHGKFAMFLRGVFGALGSLCSYYAISQLPLSQFNAITFSKPLFVMIMAVLFLGERMGARRTVAAIIGFAGVLIIVQPSTSVSPAVLAALGAAFCYAVFNILAKLLTRKNSVLTVLMYSNMLIALFLLPLAAATWTTPVVSDLPLLALMAVCGVIGQGMYIKGLSVGDASFVSNVDFIRLPMTASADFIFFKVLPPTYIWPGAALIIGSLIYISWREARLNVTEPALVEKPPS